MFSFYKQAQHSPMLGPEVRINNVFFSLVGVRSGSFLFNVSLGNPREITLGNGGQL